MLITRTRTRKQVSVDDLSKAAQHSKEQYNVAEGDEAMTLLEDFTTRTNFINELIEVRVSFVIGTFFKFCLSKLFSVSEV